MTTLSMQEDEVCLCALSGLIDLVARKWSLFVLNIVGNRETLRFNQIANQLGGDVSPTTLTDTLERLVAGGLLKRTSYAETPPRVEYSLTRDGKELWSAMHPLLLWAAKRDPARAKDPGCPVFGRVQACP